jgi:hypothetical protein
MKDKVVRVTGGSSGIGRASALAFARKGAALIAHLIMLRGVEEPFVPIAAFTEAQFDRSWRSI